MSKHFLFAAVLILEPYLFALSQRSRTRNRSSISTNTTLRSYLFAARCYVHLIEESG